MRSLRLAVLLALSGIAGYVAPLAGDTYPRQATVDAQHYVFRLTLSDTSPEIVGEATVTVRLTADNVRDVVLDLTSAHDGRAMTVTAASRDGATVTFSHATNRLTLPIAAGSRSGQLVSFTIQYHGIPASPDGHAARRERPRRRSRAAHHSEQVRRVERVQRELAEPRARSGCR